MNALRDTNFCLRTTKSAEIDPTVCVFTYITMTHQAHQRSFRYSKPVA